MRKLLAMIKADAAYQTEEARPSEKNAACQTSDAVPTEEVIKAWDAACPTSLRVLVPRRFAYGTYRLKY